MKYIFKCKCGRQTVYETDLKPPKSIKCRSCKETVKLNPDDSENVFDNNK